MGRIAGLQVEHRADGCTLVRSTRPLPAYPTRVTERLDHWAAQTPDTDFLAERRDGAWRRVTYRQARDAVRSIAQALLQRGLSAERPVLILSGNSIDHALLGLACLHVGIPYAPISAAYSLASTDFMKLRQIVALATPGLVFAAGAAHGPALAATVPAGVETVTELGALAGATPSDAVAAAAGLVNGDTVAKLLFTSGSTGSPKAVINTHRMLCANQAMIAGVFCTAEFEPPVLLDWLPWSHTFGGNHNFNLVLFHGGTLFIDAGRPVPGQFGPTVAALREIAPTLHLSVPKAWEELARHLDADPALNRRFFSRLRVPFYAAASLPQPLWDRLQRLSRAATGRVVPMLTGYGSTETAPMALCTDGSSDRAGHIGLPVLGVELKLVAAQGKLEMCIRGPLVTPGYWRDPVRTASAFDAEGFYPMGDAATWLDPARPEAGLCFDGRLAEDFKLTSGTWVSVGPLRAHLIAAMAPDIRDIVVAGHDRDAVAVLAIPADPAAVADRAVRDRVGAVLSRLARQAPGSAARVTRLAFLTDTLSIDAGEVTDKGSINQAAVLRCRPAAVAALYAEPPPPHVLCAEPAPVQA